MAQLSLMVIGAAVGTVVGGPGFGTWAGAQIGSTLGGHMDRQWLFPAEATLGPRVDNLKVQSSSAGVAIKRVWGTVRIGGNIIWATDIEERRRTIDPGKGQDDYIEFKYYGTFAIAMCEGELDSVIRVWAGSDLIVDFQAANDQIVQIPDLQMRVYLGDETQLPDPDIEAEEGEGEVPGHRGLAYIVFIDFPLERYGNQVPAFNFEVAKDVTEVLPFDPIVPYDPPTVIWGAGNMVTGPWSYWGRAVQATAGIWTLVNLITGEIIATAVDIGENDLPYFCEICVDERGYVYTTERVDPQDLDTLTLYASRFVVVDADTLTVRQTSGHVCTAFYDCYVSDLPEYPWLFYVQWQGELWFGHRDYLYCGLFHDIPGYHCHMVSKVSLNNGTAWAVWSTWNGHVGSTATYLQRLAANVNDGGAAPVSTVYDITADVEHASRVMIDVASGQVIVGGWVPGDEDFASRLVFYDDTELDSDERPLRLGVLDAGVGPGSKEAWRFGTWFGNFYFGALNTIHRVNVYSRTLTKTWNVPANAFGGSMYVPGVHAMYGGWLVGDQDWYRVLLDRVTDDGVPLSTIASDLAEGAGLDVGSSSGSEVDVSELIDLVRGFTMDARVTYRSTIESLADAYFFDAIESGGIVKFLKRGRDPSVDIPEVDLAARTNGRAPVEKLVTTKQQELELPDVIEVDYVNREANYDLNTQRANRVTVHTRDLTNISIPIVLSDDDAKRIAEKHLATIWTQRTRYVFTVSRKYVYLDPGDVVTLTVDGVIHTVRIEQMQHDAGVLEVEAVEENTADYTSAATGSSQEGVVDAPPIEYGGPTKLVLLDWDGWTGADVHQSVSGSKGPYRLWGTSDREAIIGGTTGIGELIAVTDPFIWDRGSEINVRLIDLNDELISASEADVLDGANLAVVGDEIVQFADVVAEEDGSFTLSTFLRGRKGTEWATGTHLGGAERFVLLTPEGVNFQTFDSQYRDVALWYTTRSFGSGVGPSKVTPRYQFTNTVRTMKPKSPQHVQGTRDGANDLTIKWMPRVRFGGEWEDGTDIHITDLESWEIDVYDGSTIVRTIVESTLTGAVYTGYRSAIYTAARQAADGLTPGQSVDVVVYQIGSPGRGFGSDLTTV